MNVNIDLTCSQTGPLKIPWQMEEHPISYEKYSGLVAQYFLHLSSAMLQEENIFGLRSHQKIDMNLPI